MRAAHACPSTITTPPPSSPRQNRLPTVVYGGIARNGIASAATQSRERKTCGHHRLRPGVNKSTGAGCDPVHRTRIGTPNNVDGHQDGNSAQERARWTVVRGSDGVENVSEELDITESTPAVYRLYFLVSYASTGSPTFIHHIAPLKSLEPLPHRSHGSLAVALSFSYLEPFSLSIDSPCDRLEASHITYRLAYSTGFAALQCNMDIAYGGSVIQDTCFYWNKITIRCFSAMRNRCVFIIRSRPTLCPPALMTPTTPHRYVRPKPRVAPMQPPLSHATAREPPSPSCVLPP
jgi:hypothetical protein